MKKIIWTSVIAGIMQIQAGAMELPEDSASENPARAYTEALRNLEKDLFHHEELMSELLPVSHLMPQLFLNMKDLTSRMIELTSAGIRAQEEFLQQLAISNNRIEKLEEENRSLEQRISALETATTKKEQEEKKKLMDEPKQMQEQKEVTEQKQEGSFVATGHRELGNFKFGLRWKYNGEIIRSGDNVEAEGKGEFSWGPLKIIGSFSHNRLDLSDAIVKGENLEVSFNSGGYFNLENIKRISGNCSDEQKKQITARMPDGSKYIFSPNLIQFVTKDGQISEFIAER